MEGKLTLGYWGIRGLAQVSRLLLAYTNTPFNDVTYTEREKWDQDKKNLGLDFPNLPYLIDGDFKLTESSAIERYIINRSGKTELNGKDEKDQAEVNRLISVIGDAFKDIKKLVWNKEFEAEKAATLEKVKGKFEELQKYLCHKSFFLGYVTLADFILAENSYTFQTLYPLEWKKYSFLGTIRRNFNALPAIKAYYASETGFKGPFMPSFASVLIEAKEEEEEHKHTGISLGYWGIRGLAQVPRLLLAHCGVDFHDHFYASSEEWFNKDKVALSLKFANIPYLTTDDIRLTESSAICKYIGSKWSKELNGKDAKDAAVVDEILGVLKDAMSELSPLFFNPKHEELKGAALEKVKGKFELLAKFIGERTSVLSYVTLADFSLSEYSYYVEKLFPEEYKGWKFFNTIRHTINTLPAVTKYYAKEGSMKAPFIPGFAPLAF